MEKFGFFFGGLFFFCSGIILTPFGNNLFWLKNSECLEDFSFFSMRGCWIKGENAFAKQKIGKIRSDFYCRHFCHQKVAKSKMVSFWISSWSLILKNRHPKKACVASQNVQNPNWRENENTTMSRPRQDISWHISTNSVNISSSFFGIIFSTSFSFFGLLFLAAFCCLCCWNSMVAFFPYCKCVCVFFLGGWGYVCELE